MKENPGTTESYEFDRDIYDALDAAGWMFPETPDDVERAEKEMEQNSIKLPDHLSIASAVFDEMCNSPADESDNCTIRFPHDENIAKNLARAARDGDITNMKWLKTAGCPWDKDTFLQASYHGNITNMKWLKTNGCPYFLEELQKRLSADTINQLFTINLDRYVTDPSRLTDLCPICHRECVQEWITTHQKCPYCMLPVL